MLDLIHTWLSHNAIFTPHTLLHYWHGVVTTIQLVFLSLVVGLLCALPLGILRTVKNIWVSGPIFLFTYTFRGTPLLVQLYIIYYGIPVIPGIEHTFWWDFLREPFYPALIAFALNTAAYQTEIIRGALQATPHGEIEAAKAYGMSWWKRMRRIVIPSAFRRGLQAYSNEVIFMLHSSAIAGVVTIVDITGAARDTYSQYYAPFAAFIFAAAIYMVLSFSIIFGFRKLEGKLLAHLKPVKN